MLSKSRDDFDEVWPELHKALVCEIGGHSTHSQEEIWSYIVNDEAQLWLYGDSCCLTTNNELRQSGRAPLKYVNGWLSAGKLEELRDHVLPEVEAYARAQGADFLSGSGREAWGRAVRQTGFKPAYTHFVKALR